MRYETQHEDGTDRYAVVDMMTGKRIPESFTTQKAAHKRATLENDRWRKYVAEPQTA